jgi:hypothetical protein
MAKQNDGAIEELSNSFNELVDGTSDINKLLLLWSENGVAVKKFEELDEKIKAKIKIFLKERRWDSYLDKDSKISVKITSQERKSYDEEKLKSLLGTRINDVIKITTFERMQIITPQTRERLSKYVRGK